MSFLNKDNFDADALMMGSSDEEEQAPVVQQPTNLAHHKVSSPPKLFNPKDSPLPKDLTQKTRETSNQHSQFQNGNGLPEQQQNISFGEPMRSKKKEDRFKMHPKAAMLEPNVPDGMAIRTQDNFFIPAGSIVGTMKWVLKEMSRRLNDLVKDNIEQFYQEQFYEVSNILMRAFTKQESNSLLLLSRSKQTLHAFLNEVQHHITEQAEAETQKQQQELSSKVSGIKTRGDSGNGQPVVKQLKVVRVNSILNNSETKILEKFCECLQLKEQKNQTVEMIDRVREYFKENPGLCLAFILEDIDFYIESTKQIVLYRILDMLQYLSIPFVFLATSQKLNIVDSFEKRIKSRFSYKQIFFYEESLPLFMHAVKKIAEEYCKEIAPQKEDPDKQYENMIMDDVIQHLNWTLDNPQLKTFMELVFDQGNGYEFLSKQLQIILSSIEAKLAEQELEEDQAKVVEYFKFVEFYHKQFAEAMKHSTFFIYQANEKETLIQSLPQSSLIVLVSARKVSSRTPLFNFEAVYQKYKTFIMNLQKQQGANLQELSRQTFLKLFLDMVAKGFLKSESQVDILSVNNKVAFGVNGADFDRACSSSNLPTAVQNWASSQLM